MSLTVNRAYTNIPAPQPTQTPVAFGHKKHRQDGYYVEKCDGRKKWIESSVKPKTKIGFKLMAGLVAIGTAIGVISSRF